MNYFALTEAVASWLVGKVGLIDSLHEALMAGTGAPITTGEEFVEGPFHIALSRDSQVIGLWNVDYLSGTGEEAWGFIRLGEKLGLAGYKEISREVLERCIYVISQRLQGFRLDGALLQKTWANGTHTYVAGRGTDARHLSIGYSERVIGDAGVRQQGIVCIGPDPNWRVLEKNAGLAGLELDGLIDSANSLFAPGRSTKLSSPDVLARVRASLETFTSTRVKAGIGDIEVAVAGREIDSAAKFKAPALAYQDWERADSSLTQVQRRILTSDALDRHPIRIIGPGGAGKTLLMQLLAVRRLILAKERGEPLKLVYVVHNQAMAQKVKQNFDVLLSATSSIDDGNTALEVKTLSEIARELLEIEDAHIIDRDAGNAKKFQYEQVKAALYDELNQNPVVESSALLLAARGNHHLLEVLAFLVMQEISLAIKGQGLSKDKKKYVQSSRSLSRLHGALSEQERDFVFRVYERYHSEVFESLEVLDSDDLAISLLGRLRTPIWELRRRQSGYDYVFVDETQLFNENERRIIPLLTNSMRKFVPVVLALDEAQAIYGVSSTGFAALGMEGITSESLSSIHRSTKSIIDLAFFVIQRSTDLFGADFPDFTNIADKIEPDSHPLAAIPVVESVVDPKQDLSKFVLKRVRELRKSNVRQICVVVHADQYWEAVVKELTNSDLPLHVMENRGERLPVDEPIVVLTQPPYVGGQEFDAVVLVGLEQGVVPPRVIESEALATAVEQQALREIYVSLTRARYRVVVALSHNAYPTAVIAEAAKHGLIKMASKID